MQAFSEKSGGSLGLHLFLTAEVKCLVDTKHKKHPYVQDWVHVQNPRWPKLICSHPLQYASVPISCFGTFNHKFLYWCVNGALSSTFAELWLHVVLVKSLSIMLDALLELNFSCYLLDTSHCYSVLEWFQSFVPFECRCSCSTSCLSICSNFLCLKALVN